MLDTAPAPLLDSSLGVSTPGPNTSASVANLSSTLGGGGRTIRPLTQVRYHHPYTQNSYCLLVLIILNSIENKYNPLRLRRVVDKFASY